MKSFKPVFSILFMLLTLGLAFGLDRWISIQRSLVSVTFQHWPWMVSSLLSSLLLSVALVLLVWWILARGSRWYVSLVFLLIGLAALLYPVLRISINWAIIRQLPLMDSLDNRMTFAGAFIAVLGALSWVLAGRMSRQGE